MESKGQSFRVRETCLERHSKTALQRSPQTIEVDGDLFQNLKKKNNKKNNQRTP